MLGEKRYDEGIQELGATKGCTSWGRRSSFQEEVMRTINRSALLVRPKEPYLDWARNVDDDPFDAAQSLRGKTSVYLVAQDPEEREESAALELYFQEIFESELEAWHTEKPLGLRREACKRSWNGSR